MSSLVTTKSLYNRKVISGKKEKKVGKVRHFIFHPTEKRCIGFTVKRPDAAMMFRRKDQFVALNGYDENDEGDLVVRDDPQATDKGACKALGVNWDACVIWVGMPAMTASGEFLGYVDTVTFDAETGDVESMTTENGAANDVLLGKRSIPASLVKGFRRGQGIALVPMGDYAGEEEDDIVERGAILVADAALELEVQGGAAAAAGKATAIATDKAKKGAAKAKVVVVKKAVKAKAAADNRAAQAKPVVRMAAEKTESAVNKGAYAAGKQLGKATGMFSAFKQEFDKALHEDDAKHD